jgi:branched-chain amino acid transport system permease protein
VTELLQQVISGVLVGSVYALMALALVLIVRSTGIINFAQGEMATFTAYIGWTLMQHMPYWAAFVLAVGAGFALGALLEWGLIRRVQGREALVPVIVTLGLFLFLNSFDLSVWGSNAKAFEPPFRPTPIHLGGISISSYSLYVFAVSVVLLIALWLLLQRTRVGLAMRATAIDRTAAELAGARTGRMLMLGWGLSGALGAVAAMLIAPLLVLNPNMMFFILIFAFASAVLGGIESAVGALVGAVVPSVTQNLVGTYLDDVVKALHIADSLPDANQYRNIVALSLILVVLAVRPRGLFGRVVREKV